MSPSRAWLMEALITTGLELDLTHGEAVTHAQSILRELGLKLKDPALSLLDDNQRHKIETFILAAARSARPPIVVVTRAVGAWELMAKTGGGEVVVKVPRKRERTRWIDQLAMGIGDANG